MKLWPFKHIAVETSLKKEEINRIITNATDQDQKSIYWGKRFHKKYWGSVKENVFRIRPVVPYWNISPVEITGEIVDSSQDKNLVDLKLRCPYMRVIVPLVIVAVGLFFINFGLKGEMGVFLSAAGIILISSLVLVNVPFQIQSNTSMEDLYKKLKGEVKKKIQ